MSYQHGFHAGNFADVLKHAVLCQVVDYLLQKNKPFYFHDTHAGRGLYDLTHPVAQKTGEYRDGIARIWNRRDYPAALLPYIHTLQSFNTGTGLRMYAGSSLLAQRMMTGADRLAANELHPQEFQALRDNTKELRNLRISQQDGYAALKAALPPQEKRGLVLIDPSYELLADDVAVVNALRESLKRFATGIYLVWYPVVEPARARKMVRAVAALSKEKVLQLELFVRDPVAGNDRVTEKGGMAGSGMLLVNPPWQLDVLMQEALPWLVKQLAPETGSFRVEWLD
ncbi:MAG TPA: 23S rRNA (adenine(2030)-N(6))-methyltransferase RlmJ [Pseudomonadales bacterium]|nr:23S rRNA (adenine(2030)-N(6))-methyltransferase RlmJ [Pseudomonadales bacterium]